ncbi:hypothetical protein HK102_004589 [Quaeritorhiza haematococci]|nr:hypothetical protein HK102_004589 [Quaeritorhiza haematococci]
MSNWKEEPSIKAVIIGGDITLADVLAGTAPVPLDLESFRAYCRKRLVDENLEFWFAVEHKFKRISNFEEYAAAAEEIHSTYVKNGAAKEINIPVWLKNDVEKNLSGIKSAQKTDTPKIDINLYDKAQEHVFAMLNTDVMPGFKHLSVQKQRLHLARKEAMWWKNPPTLKEFFSFPNPINTADSVIHYTITCIWLLVGVLLNYFYGVKWVFIPLTYGFVARTLCGPRLDPQAFLVLFVLRPLLSDRWEILPTSFVPGPPKRFAHVIGSTFAITTTTLIYCNQQIPAYAVAGCFFCAAFLGGAFNYCIACKIFYYLMRMGLVPISVCETCYVNYVKYDAENSTATVASAASGAAPPVASMAKSKAKKNQRNSVGSIV